LQRLRRSTPGGAGGEAFNVGRLSITLKRSTIGFPRDQRGTVAGLGLRRLHQTVEHEDTPSIRGMLHKVRHLVEVKPAGA
jgi:large subunit ribosomal protein L30